MAAALIKTQEAQPVGEYVRSSVDEARDVADILIVGHQRNGYSLIRTKLPLTGFGVVVLSTNASGERFIRIRDSKLDELRKTHRIATDF